MQSVRSATRGDNVLDLAVSCGGAVTSEVRDSLFASDHLVISTKLKMQYDVAPRASRMCVYNYKRTDFGALRLALRLVPWTVMERMDVNSAVDYFYDFVFFLESSVLLSPMLCQTPQFLTPQGWLVLMFLTVVWLSSCVT